MGGYLEITQREQPVLFATLFSEGLERRSFERALGWNYGVEEHRYESGRHYVPDRDADRLRQVVAERAESEPHFWPAYVDRGVSKGQALVDVARSLAAPTEEAHRSRDLLEAFEAFAGATRVTVPFLVATPVVRAALEKAAGVTARSAGASVVPEGIHEIRNCYRIASTIMDDDRALDVLRTTSPALAAGTLEQEFPDLYGLLRDHVDTYGWLWRDGQGCEPGSINKLVERIQAVLLRWERETVTQAARGSTAETAPPGPPPPEAPPELAGVLRELAIQRAFGWALHRQAECLAAPFVARMAEALGCTADQVTFSSAKELRGALAGEAELPVAEIDRRISNSFTVERSGDTVRVHGHETPPPEGESAQGALTAITGTSACRGRAVGPVRVVHTAAELQKLEAGEILVTATSSPEVIGGGSAFPTRTGAPPGLENAAAIVTDDGGFLSHAAIVSREYQIPCVVGTEHATARLLDGQVVEVDATRQVGQVVPLGGP